MSFRRDYFESSQKNTYDKDRNAYLDQNELKLCCYKQPKKKDVFYQLKRVLMQV